LNVPRNVVPKGLPRGLARELPNAQESEWLRESENEPLNGQESEALNVSLNVRGSEPQNALESEQQRG
jgi:hypothetical protein